MKHILQAMDGVTNKPVEGAESMAKFLRVVDEAAINQPTTKTPPAKPTSDLTADEMAAILSGQKTQAQVMADRAANKKEAVADVKESMDQFLSIVKKNDVSILNEGANPHKVALPVQMAMQHYQQAESTTTASTESSMFKKYFHEVESEVNEQAQAKRQVVNQYASVIAERVMKKQSKNTILNEEESEEANERRRYPHYYKHKDKTVFRVGDSTAPNGYRDIHPENDEWDSIYQQEFPDYPIPKDNDDSFEKDSITTGPDDQDQNVGEMAIAHNPADANNPMIHGHEKANSMNLKDRIAQARAQLKELAQLADSNELIVWEKITRLSKGGMFMGLEQNLEQIRHGINELVQARKTGKQVSPKARGAIDKHIG